MATVNQRLAAKRIKEQVGKGGTVSVSKAMRGLYSPSVAKNPKKLTESKGWQELMAEHLGDAKLAQAHDALLNSHSLDHMVFPLNVTDEEIIEMLEEVNCTTRRFMHSDTQTHVWFWSPDNRARKEALEMAYKLKGRYAATKVSIVDPYGELDDEELEREIARRHSDGGPAQKPEAEATR